VIVIPSLSSPTLRAWDATPDVYSRFGVKNTYSNDGFEMVTAMSDGTNLFTVSNFTGSTGDIDPDSGSVSYTSAGSKDVLVTKVNPTNGSLLAHKRFGGTGQVRAYSAVYGRSSLYLAVSFTGSVDFGQGNLTTSSQAARIAILKLNSADLTIQKIEEFGVDTVTSANFDFYGPGGTNVLLSLTSAGVVAAGTLMGVTGNNISIGGQSYTTSFSQSAYRSFIARFDDSGVSSANNWAASWAYLSPNTDAATAQSYITSVTADATTTNIYVTGARTVAYVPQPLIMKLQFSDGSIVGQVNDSTVPSQPVTSVVTSSGDFLIGYGLDASIKISKITVNASSFTTDWEKIFSRGSSGASGRYSLRNNGPNVILAGDFLGTIDFDWDATATSNKSSIPINKRNPFALTFNPSTQQFVDINVAPVVISTIEEGRFGEGPKYVVVGTTGYFVGAQYSIATMCDATYATSSDVNGFYSTEGFFFSKGDTPCRPLNLQATARVAGANVSFTPGEAKTSAVSNYEYQIAPNGSWSGTWTALNPADNTSPISITGLTPGVSYNIKLRAVSPGGTSLESNAVTNVVPLAVTPPVITGMSATSGSNSLIVNFSPTTPPSGATLVGYEYKIDNGAWTSASLASNSFTISSGLTNGTEAVVVMRALTDQGPSSASNTAQLLPGTPSAVSVSVTGLTARVTTTLSTSSLISTANLEYSLSANGGTTFTNWTSLTPADADGIFDISGLTGETTYLVRVRQVNAWGVGGSITSASVTTPAIPAAPTLGAVAQKSTTSGRVVVRFPVTWNWVWNQSEVVTKLNNGWGEWKINDGNWSRYLCKGGYFSTTDRNCGQSGTAMGFSDIQLAAGAAGQTVYVPIANLEDSNISVRVCTSAGCGPASNVQNLTTTYITSTYLAPAPSVSSGNLITSTSAEIAITAPQLGGSNPSISDYLYQYSSDAGSTWSSWISTSNSLTATVSGLTPSQNYLVRVRAVNSYGGGAVSSTVSLTTSAPPTTTTTVPANPASSGAIAPSPQSASVTDISATVTFSAGTSGSSSCVNANVTYRVAKNSDQFSSWKLSTTNALVNGSIRIVGLDPGSNYRVELRTSPTAAGCSPSSESSTLTFTTKEPTYMPTANGKMRETSTLVAVFINESGSTEPADRSVNRSDKSLAAGDLNQGDGEVDITMNLQGNEAGATEVTTVGELVFISTKKGLATGEGFMPGTTVEVWVASTPTLLGTATVNSDGTFTANFTVPKDLLDGKHTVQAEGVSISGDPRALSAGVVVKSPGNLPVTGSDMQGILFYSIGLICCGYIIVSVKKSRGSQR
jgi:hypothetical protein